MIMSVKEWLYFLLLEDGRSRYQMNNGNIGSTPVPTPLVYSPDAWQDITFSMERDRKRHGMWSKFSFPLGFFGDGATIIRDAAYKEGQEKELFLHITRRTVEIDKTVFPYSIKDYHTKYFRAPLDLSSMIDGEDKITVKISDTGLGKKIKANENTKYEFPLSDPEAINLVMDGLPLQQTSNFMVTESSLTQAKTQHGHLVGAGLSVTEGQAPGFAGHQVYDQGEPDNLGDSIEYLWETRQAINNMKIKGEVMVRKKNIWNTVKPASYKLMIHSVVDGVASQNILLGTLSFGAGLLTEYQTLAFDTTFNGAEGEKFFLVGEILSDGIDPNSTFSPYALYGETRFSISFNSTYRASTIRCFQPHILLDKIIEKICGQRNKSVSTLLSSLKYKDLCLTSGDGMRGIAGALVKISLNEFLDIYQINTFGGSSVEKEQFLFEIITRYYDASDPYDLGEVADVEASFATDMQGNTIRVGHKVHNIDEVNGKYAFNNTLLFSTDRLTKIDELKFVSPAIADPFVIENIRINFDGKTTTDSDSDNDLILLATAPDKTLFYEVEADFFMLFSLVPSIRMPGGATYASLFQPGFQFNVSGGSNSRVFTVKSVQSNGTDLLIFVDGPVVEETAMVQFSSTINKLLRESYSSVSGVPDSSKLFNVVLSPKRILMLWKKWLNSSFYKMAGSKIKYQSTERNSDLKTVLNGVTIEEKADEEFGTDLIYKPIYFKFKCHGPVDYMNLKEQNPNRCFRFTWNNAWFKGFDITTGVCPDDNRPQQYWLLCTPDTDETPLID